LPILAQCDNAIVVGPGSAADKPPLGISAPGAETRQITIDPRSPAIVSDHNNITYNDIDARSLKRLKDQLDEKNLTKAQKIAEADEWARKYHELDQQLTEARSQAAAKGDYATLVKAAQDLLHKGKLEEAGNIYDQLLARDESNVDRVAQDHFGRAKIYALQFRPLAASLRDGLSISTGSRRICAWVRPDIGTSETV